MRSSIRFLFLGLALIFAFGGTAWGQVTATRFNLSTPGARSLGMGGAFLGLADDATAAYANPAGLTNLTEGGPQVAVELRNWSYSTPYVAEGRMPGSSPTRIGLDFGAGLVKGSAESEISDLSFASVGYVLPRGVTVALYKNQLANYVTDFKSEGWFFDLSSTATSAGICLRYDLEHDPVCRTLPRAYATEVKVDSIGFAVAYEFQRPFRSSAERPFSVGVGVAHYQLTSETLTATFRFNSALASAAVADGIFSRSQYLPANFVNLTDEQGDDAALGLNLGLLWKLEASGDWAVGGVFRQGPKFKTDRLALSRDGGARTFEGTVKIPDIYGLGISYSPPHSEGRTKVALDYQKTLYSQRLRDFFIGTPDPLFAVPDANEVHLGVEQVVVTSGKFVGTARVGGWRESAHEIEYQGNDAPTRALYAPGGYKNHWAVGLGLVIGELYQIDAAFDHSALSKTFSFSVVRFF